MIPREIFKLVVLQRVLIFGFFFFFFFFKRGVADVQEVWANCVAGKQQHGCQSVSSDVEALSWLSVPCPSLVLLCVSLAVSVSCSAVYSLDLTLLYLEPHGRQSTTINTYHSAMVTAPLRFTHRKWQFCFISIIILTYYGAADGWVQPSCAWYQWWCVELRQWSRCFGAGFLLQGEGIDTALVLLSWYQWQKLVCICSTTLRWIFFFFTLYVQYVFTILSMDNCNQVVVPFCLVMLSFFPMSFVISSSVFQWTASVHMDLGGLDLPQW